MIMRKKLFVMAALALGMAMSVTLTSCGDDEPTPQEQPNDPNGGDDNGGQSGEDKTPAGVVAVDLGLPSGTLWANMNVGATVPEAYGNYFAWGETVPYGGEDKSNATNYAYAGTYTKTYYGWETYKYCNGSDNTLTKYCQDSNYGYDGFTDNLTELTTADDAAYVNWGPDWRMPTKGQFEELINSSYTTTEWLEQNGVYGRKITSKANGNSIFLPAAGSCNGSRLGGSGGGYYWSRTLSTDDPYARSQGIFGGGFSFNSNSRFSGLSVRPVRVSQ